MSNIGIALQLYTLRDEAARDLPGTLARVRDCGFDFVQWSGMPRLSAGEIRRHLEDAGLKAVAAHHPLEAFEEDFEAAAAYWETVGVPDIAAGTMMEDCQGDVAAWRRGGMRLEAVGAKLAARGIRLSYHNHAFELERFPGEEQSKLDQLFAQAHPEHLHAELDTAWLYLGGADPAAYIRRYAGRCPLLHVKDCRDTRDSAADPVFVPLGQGVLDWDDILDAGEEAAVEWYIYEQDTCEGDPFDSLQASYAFLEAHA